MNKIYNFFKNLCGFSIHFKLIVFYLFFALIHFVFYFLLKYFEGGYLNLKLCFSFSCLSYFFSEFEGLVDIFKFYLETLFYIISMVSLYVAINHYVRANISSNMATHIGNANTFKDYIEMDIKKSGIIGLSSIDCLKWYNFVYPDSRGGNLEVSQYYKDKIREINNIIKHSNSEVRFDYKRHQTEIIASLNEIGIEVGRSPRNNFNEVERYIFGLIKKVNKDFCFIDDEVSMYEPTYY